MGVCVWDGSTRGIGCDDDTASHGYPGPGRECGTFRHSIGSIHFE